MNRDADIILLRELLDPGQRLRRRITCDDDADTSPFAIFELRADILILVFSEINRAGGMKLDAIRRVVGKRFCLLVRIHWEMILNVLDVEVMHAKLLHEAEHLSTSKVSECVAGNSKTQRRGLAGLLRWRAKRQTRETRGRPCEKPGANQVTA